MKCETVLAHRRPPATLVAMRAASLLALLCIAGLPAQDRELAWFKGNLHTHSLWSDGNDFPEMIADWYASRGYHFLALSDHNILSDHEKWMDVDMVVRRGGRQALSKYRDRFGDDWVETRRGEDGKLEVRLKTLTEFRPLLEREGSFLMVQGEEISDRFGDAPIHLNASNLVEKIAPQGGDTVAQVIENNVRAVREQARRLAKPILAHLNHPNFRWAITAEDIAAAVSERYFEVYNGHDQVNHLGDDRHASVEQLWDIANTIRIAEMGAPPLFGVATDDSHNYFSQLGSTPGRGWVMVQAPALDADALIEAMEAGRFYASSGVTLRSVEFDGDTLRVQVDAEEGVHYGTVFVGTRAGYDPTSQPVVDAEGKELPVTRRYSPDIGTVLHRAVGTRVSYRLRGDELYVRAVVTATRRHDNPSFREQRQQAWTQPVGWRAR